MGIVLEFNEKTALKARLEQLVTHERQIQSERNEILIRLNEIDEFEFTYSFSSNRVYQHIQYDKNQIYPLLIFK